MNVLKHPFFDIYHNEMIIFWHYNDNKDTEDCYVLVSLVFSGLSLVLNKGTRNQTFNVQFNQYQNTR